MFDLTKSDLNVLIEAMDSWESKHLPGMMMETILGGLLPKDDPIAVAKYKAEAEARRRKDEDERRVRQERSILLKAKLIQLRDNADADAFLASSH